MNSLVDRVKEHCSWMRGEYPTSIQKIVEREPELASTFGETRKQGIKNVAADGVFGVAVASLTVPAIFYSGIIATTWLRLSVIDNYVKEAQGRANAKTRSQQEKEAALEGATSPAINDRERSLAFTDLDLLVNDARILSNGALSAATICGYAAPGLNALSEGRTGTGVFYLVAGALMSGAQYLFHRGFDRRRQTLENQRQTLVEDIDRLESIALENAKRITPIVRETPTYSDEGKNVTATIDSEHSPKSRYSLHPVE